MNGLRRLAVVSLFVGSCTSLMGPEPGPETYECVPSAPDTVTWQYPDQLRLVVGGADRAWVERFVEDGCNSQTLSVAGLTIEVRDAAVARTISDDPGSVIVVPEAPGASWVVFSGPDYLDSIPVTVPEPDTLTVGPITSVAATGSTSCATDESARVLCWGGDQFGLMYPALDVPPATCFGNPCSPMPRSVDIEADDLFFGENSFCYRDASGLVCPDGGADVTRFGAPEFASVATNWSYTCGVTTSSELFCWGEGGAGQLGLGPDLTWTSQPRQINEPAEWSSVDVAGNAYGDGRTCGVAGGALYCWGFLPESVGAPSSCVVSPGGKGSGPTYAPCSYVPHRIALPNGLGADTVIAEIHNRCLLTTQGGILCSWTEFPDFTRVADPGAFVSIEAGTTHYCGLTETGVARCWGSENKDGELGTGDTFRSFTPVTVRGGHRFADLALGRWHTCGLEVGGEVWCWGNNEVGSVGGTILEPEHLEPKRVPGLGTP